MSKHQRGFSLMELLTVVSIIGLIVAGAVPSFLNLRRRAALRAASAELRSQFHLTRSRAISHNVNCGMKFLLLGGEWHFAVYQDGDHDGVLTHWRCRGAFGRPSALQWAGGPQRTKPRAVGAQPLVAWAVTCMVQFTYQQ